MYRPTTTVKYNKYVAFDLKMEIFGVFVQQLCIKNHTTKICQQESSSACIKNTKYPGTG